MRLRLYFMAVCASLLVGCSKPSEHLLPDTPVGNFEALWQIIDEKYCFFDEKDIDWQAIHDEYRAKADTIRDDERALFCLLSSMLDSLHDGHVNLYSDFDVSRSTSWYDTLPTNYNATLVAEYIGRYQIAGALTYGLIADGQVGYIRYGSFESGFSAKNMWYVLDYFANCKGVIVDVRSNGGGNLDYAYKLASTFFETPTTVGYWRHKTGPGHNDFSEMQPIEIDAATMPYKWLKPVVVLTNCRAYSATNSFANAMRYAPNATMVGATTGGGGGMPLSYELPNGWIVRLSSVPMYNREKQSIENGVKPDVPVNLTTELAAQGKDDLIEKAIELLTKR